MRLRWLALVVGLSALAAWGSVAVRGAVPTETGSGVTGVLAARAPGQGTSMPAGTVTATPPPPCGLAWRTVPSPNINDEDILYGVAAVGPSDIWAVGSRSGGTYQPLAEHWDGTAWTIIPSPDGPSYGFYGVAAVGPDDVWAVGGGSETTSTEHWNGTAWSIVPSPNPDIDNSLQAVVAVGPNDVWAVGYQGIPDLPTRQLRTLVEHWDGAVWSVVPSPPASSFLTELNGVAAAGPNDVWAVGYYTVGLYAQTLVEHWNGTAWSIVPSPNVSAYDNVLWGVGVIGPYDVWAVGMTEFHPGSPLIEHWDGATWSVVPNPNQGNHDGTISGNILYGVAGSRSNDVWIVGDHLDDIGPYQTLMEHWNGTDWSSIPRQSGSIKGVAVVRPDDVWAVGSTGQTLTMRYSDPCAATATPTVTGTPPTATPTPVCTIAFTDVDPSNPFYPYVRCLACRNIVSGYSTSPPCSSGSPCFLPGAGVTRGQTAKFIANAAGYADPIPSTQQTFSDVPPSNPFWLYVERVYGHGVISGYSGSPPCTTGVPCFLPGNPVTRGQTAKFVSNAGGFGDPIASTRQTFSDVPSSNPFWLYIERGYLHGVIGGYSSSPPCTSGVPCFLPANGVTRGQTAKFIANTFYPNCLTLARR